MEDEHGRPIPESIKKALRKDLYGYWNDLYSAGSDDLRTYGDLGLERKDHFRSCFERSYPWLRLCAGHWKVDQLWRSYFHTWKKPRTSDPSVREPSPPSTAAVKTIPPPSVPSKRRLEGDEGSADDPSGRGKGKAKDIVAPTAFHHSRPLLQKRKAVVPLARVRMSRFLFLMIILIVCRIHCNGAYFLHNIRRIDY